MKKKLTLLFFLSFIFYSCHTIIEDDTYWIAVNSDAIPPDTGSYIYDGMILHFINGQVEISDVFGGVTSRSNFRIEDSTLYKNDTIFARIQFLSKDSLVLVVPRDMPSKIKLISLDKEKSISGNTSIWKHQNWKIYYSNESEQIKLFDNESFTYPNREAKLALVKNISKDKYYSQRENWNFTTINGNHIFARTYGQGTLIIYRIIEYLRNSILLECISRDEISTVKMEKILPISQENRIDIKNKIQEEIWKTKQVLRLENLGRGSCCLDSIFIKKSSVNKNGLSFKFSKNSKYEIFEYDNLRAEGIWNLSKDGKEIILDKGIFPSDFIEILNIEKKFIVLGFNRTFEPEFFDGLFDNCYFELQLENNSG